MRRPNQTVEILAALQVRDAHSRRVRVQDLGNGRGRAPSLNPDYRVPGLITMATMIDQMSIQPAGPGRPRILSVSQRG